METNGAGNSTGTEIIEFGEEHQERITDIIVAVREGGANYPPRYVPNDRTSIAEWLDKARPQRRFVAIQDGILIGHIQISETGGVNPGLKKFITDGDDNPEAAVDLSRLFVHPEHQSCGVGKMLLRHATTEALHMGYKPLACVPAENFESLTLFKKEGWATIGSYLAKISRAEMVVMSAPDDTNGSTAFIHSGVRPNNIGAVTTGIEVSTTFAMDYPGEYGEFAYARSQNPTRKALEEALVAAENGEHGMAFSSGLAAIDTVLRLLSPGDAIMIGTDAYGGTWRLLDGVWSRYGIETDVVDMSDMENVRNSWRLTTRMVMVETPSNPALSIVDISALSEITQERNALLVVDNTFATPWLQRPLSLGADVVVHSATKYLGGHSDVVAGAIIVNDDELANNFRFSQRAVGAVPGPFDSFLVLRGIRTLPIRMERHSENAAAVADMLTEHPAVDKVFYPWLKDHPGHNVAVRQMRAGGGMVSFTLKSGEQAAINTVRNTRLFTLAESLGAVESLIEHPASMTHAANTGSPLQVDPALIRLSVGIEDSWALIADLRQALPYSGD